MIASNPELDLSADPFADPDPGSLSASEKVKQTVKTALKNNERPLKVSGEPSPYVTEETAPVRIEGEVLPYTRIADLSGDLRLIPLEELQGFDLIIHHYDRFHSNENGSDFFTLECSMVGSEDRFLSNCGGQSAMGKIERAFSLVESGEVRGPLVARFRKTTTNNGRSFWVIE